MVSTEASRRLNEVFTSPPGILRDLRRGDILFREGDPSGMIYLVKEGLVGLTKEGDGTRSVVHISTRGNMFGLESFTSDEYKTSAEAIEQAMMVGLRRAALEQIFLRNPNIALILLTETVSQLTIMYEHVRSLTLDSSIGKILTALKEFSDANGSSEVTQDIIGERTGLSRVSVNRLIRELSDSGIISVSSRTAERGISGRPPKIITLNAEKSKGLKKEIP